MAFIIKDRVKEGTTSTGTGAIALGGAAATFDTFQSYMSNGDTTYYAIVHTTSGTDEWEVGIGTWNTGNTLTRTTVLAGSNGASAVNFSSGTKDVFMTYPASKAVYTDASGDIDINGGTIDGTTIGATTADTGKFTTLETTSNADIGGYVDLEVLSDHAAYKEGRIWYDSVHKTLNFYSDDSNVVHEVGIEEHQRVYNNTGSTITKGSPLYFSGNYTAGSIDVPTVGLADATDVNAYNAQGLAASDIPNNSYGYCIVAGQLTEVDTSSLTAGQNFFVGLTPGAVQNSSPVYPNYPMCLGWVVNSHATEGVLLVNQQNHSVNSFRVRTDAHIGDDLIVGGNLQVLGTTTTTSTSDVTAGAPFYRANEGDAIGEAGTTFSGTGLDDAFFAGHFTGTTATTYYVKIDSVGTPDTFAVSIDDFATTISTGNAITGNEQLIHSADNISVTFGATTGHTLNDKWTGTASPILVDSGFFTNRNTGTSGVGYTHMGFYYDVSEDKWILLDEYDPTPNGAINLADASTSYATLKAGTFEGDLLGDVTGDVTGNASTADSLSTSRTIGGVSFNGTANINLPGVNTAGNQDTSGNAATATALETARTIQLSGDVTGSASFDGTSNVTITAAVQDDSHAHVISNVDGLQAALDAKADDTTTITAGDGLTGGGSIGVNRTFNVGAGTGITVTADAVAHADTSTQASVNNSGRTYIQDITLDGFGHVTGLTSATETVTDTTYTAGAGLDLTGTTFSHTDTSTQASVNNSNGTVIQDITLDTYGHITGIASFDLDGRYYTETEADGRFLRVDVDDVKTGYLEVDHNVSKTVATINATDSSADAWNDRNNTHLLLENSNNAMAFYVGGTTNERQAMIQVGHENVGYAQYTGTLRLNPLGGSVTINNNTAFHDGYHPNADKWTTARTLSLSGDASGSVSWDGSANATLSVTVANDSHTHDERYYTESEADSRFVNVTGDSFSGTLTYTGSGIAVDTGGDNIDMGTMTIVGSNGTDGWASKPGIKLDSSGDFRIHASNGDATLYVDGEIYAGAGAATQRVFHNSYHPNADKWTTARTLTLSGDASGSVSWDGSANATLSVTVANNSHTHTVSNISDRPTNFSATSQTYTTIASGAWDLRTGSSVFAKQDSSGGPGTDGYWFVTGRRDTQGGYSGIFTPHGDGKAYVGYNSSGASNPIWATIWTSTTDGSGSGLDADLLDGVQGSSFLRSDADDTVSAGVTYSWSNTDTHGLQFTNSSGYQLRIGGWTSSNDNNIARIRTSSNLHLDSAANGGMYLNWYSGGTINCGSTLSMNQRDITDGNTIYMDNWYRSYGQTGWYNQSYGGGVYMLDSTWVRVYNSKAFYVANQIAATGNVTAYYSDERLKTKTGDIDGALDKIKQLKGFYYLENDLAKEKGYNNDKQQVALSAQEVQAVMPEAVSLAPFDMETLEDGTIVSKSGEDYLTVDYARLVPLLVEAIKEQQTQIDELKAKLEV